MNTKIKTLFVGFLFFGACVWMGYTFVSSQKTRQVALQNSSPEQDLTEGQKLKWSVVQQFQIRQSNTGLLFDFPHATEICKNNSYLQFIFKAYETLVAGQNPSITFSLSCEKILASSQTHAELSFEDFKSIHTVKTKTLSSGHLQSHLLYSDETFPQAWLLSSIQLQGDNAFVITPFEIQKVFNQNFEFRIE